MNQALVRSIVILVPTMVLMVAAALVFSQQRTIATLLQIVGALCLLLVATFHLFEALELFPAMGWGRADSPGHFVDLASAILGVGVFPVGYLLHALSERRRKSGES